MKKLIYDIKLEATQLSQKTEEELKVQIAIPTLTLLKLCARFLTQVKTDEKGIINTIDSHKEEIIKTLANLTLKESDGE